MRIKTFQGRTLEEVLPKIREELGPNAVVVGQRQKVQGGVAGFFGTKVIEVTAADSMPSDEQLVDLEDRLMGGDGSPSRDHDDRPAPDDDEAELAARFRQAMQMGRRGGLDVTDEWDPSQDAELAQEYGRVLEHAAAAGFRDLDVPTASATVSLPAQGGAPSSPAPAAPQPPQPQVASDPLAQAQVLAQRTHEHLRSAAERVERSPANGTYAPPRALPLTEPRPITTFSATVHDEGLGGFEPQAVPGPAAAATTVDHALRTDLALPRTTDPQLADAIGAAMGAIDLSEIAALRSAVDATRRAKEGDDGRVRARGAIDQIDRAVEPLVERMLAAGVDRDVVEHVVDAAVRHRLPFDPSLDVAQVVRSVVEELLPVHSGFPMLDRAHRAAFVGPAHAGCTSVVAKLATRYAATGMRVGVLSIVSPTPGVPVMAERAFTHLDADVRYATGPSEALDALDAFEDHDLVLVDTPGAAYLDDAVLAQVQACLLAIGIDDVHVVVPLATSGREARSIVDTFRPLGANRLVVSRIDESRHVGELLNFGFRLGLPMSYLSEGQRVPDDLHAAGARQIADRILRTDEPH